MKHLPSSVWIIVRHVEDGEAHNRRSSYRGSDALFWPLRVPWRCRRARPLGACGLPLRDGADRREPERGRGCGPAAQRRAMAAARAEKRGAGRARRGPELRPALLEPAREQAEGGGGGGGCGGGGGGGSRWL